MIPSPQTRTHTHVITHSLTRVHLHARTHTHTATRTLTHMHTSTHSCRCTQHLLTHTHTPACSPCTHSLGHTTHTVRLTQSPVPHCLFSVTPRLTLLTKPLRGDSQRVWLFPRLLLATFLDGCRHPLYTLGLGELVASQGWGALTLHPLFGTFSGQLGVSSVSQTCFVKVARLPGRHQAHSFSSVPYTG